MKAVIVLSLVALAIANPIKIHKPVRLTPDNAESVELIKGVLAGMATDASYSNIANCFTDIADAADDVYQAIADIDAGTGKDIWHGIEKLGAALQLTLGAFKQCLTFMTSDQIRLSHAIAAMENPKSYDPIKVVVNGISIEKDLNNLVKYWKAQCMHTYRTGIVSA